VVEQGHLIIKGERHEHDESDDNDTYRSEFQYGAFHRVLTLPSGARADDITASYRDGILEVRIPVDGERRDPTHVPISTD
jgi:HSP20 family protein